MARGACSAAEYQRMVAQKVAAMQAAARRKRAGGYTRAIRQPCPVKCQAATPRSSSADAALRVNRGNAWNARWIAGVS
jgi:hypothetical protein